MTHAEYWLDCTNTTANLVHLQGNCISLCRQICIFICSCLPTSIFICMHVVAEAGLLAQRALFMSHRLLGPNVAIGAIDRPADDIFFQ